MEMNAEQKTKIVVSTKANILAIISVIVVVAWWGFVLFFWSNEDFEKFLDVFYTGWFCWSVAFLCGMTSLLISARNTKGFLWNKRMILATCICLVLAIYISFFWIIFFICGVKLLKGIKGSSWSKPMALSGCMLSIICLFGGTYVLNEGLNGRKWGCEANLESLFAPIRAYCNTHDGEFPDPSKWCDLLLNEPPQESGDKYDIYWKYFSEKTFRCHSAGKIKSGYAFNKNLAGKKISDVDTNTVILFESDTGWNQNGGPEIMCFERHKSIFGESGSYVLCVGEPRVRFIPASEVQKLRWNP